MLLIFIKIIIKRTQTCLNLENYEQTIKDQSVKLQEIYIGQKNNNNT